MPILLWVTLNERKRVISRERRSPQWMHRHFCRSSTNSFIWFKGTSPAILKSESGNSIRKSHAARWVGIEVRQISYCGREPRGKSPAARVGVGIVELGSADCWIWSGWGDLIARALRTRRISTAGQSHLFSSAYVFMRCGYPVEAGGNLQLQN
jgi:hypothetical protein